MLRGFGLSSTPDACLPRNDTSQGNQRLASLDKPISRILLKSQQSLRSELRDNCQLRPVTRQYPEAEGLGAYPHAAEATMPRKRLTNQSPLDSALIGRFATISPGSWKTDSHLAALVRCELIRKLAIGDFPRRCNFRN